MLIKILISLLWKDQDGSQKSDRSRDKHSQRSKSGENDDHDRTDKAQPENNPEKEE